MKTRIVPLLAVLSLLAGSYLVAGLGLDDEESDHPQAVPTQGSGSFPSASTTQYRLTAWSELGMHCIDGKDYSVFSVLPPYNIIHAQLMTLADPPVLVTSGVNITYRAVADPSGSINTTSSTKTNFWDWDNLLFPRTVPPVITLVNPPPDVGLTGNAVQSLTPHPLTYNSGLGYWEATGIPTIPYDDKGNRKPYVMALLTATDSKGNILATAKTVLAVSDEMSCSVCHASNSDHYAKPKEGWVNHPDPSKDTKLNILRKHDERFDISSYLSQLALKGYNYKSTLEATANALTPVLCDACHASNALAEGGLPRINPLTQDMHTLHGPQIYLKTGKTLDNASTPFESCYLCHPGIQTKCQRGAMSTVACFSCHGNLTYVGQATRKGWLTEPACQMCHQDSLRYTTTFDLPGHWRASTDQTFATNQNVPSPSFELYRYSKGHGTIYCSSCHGSQHAEFPTSQVNDNVYSTNLQGYKGTIRECAVCHNPVPVTRTGGPHGLHTVGQSWVDSHHDYVEGNQASCQYCHGMDYKGTFLSQLKTAKTFDAGDFGTKTFPAGHMISCYDCHNGPGGGD